MASTLHRWFFGFLWFVRIRPVELLRGDERVGHVAPNRFSVSTQHRVARRDIQVYDQIPKSYGGCKRRRKYTYCSKCTGQSVSLSADINNIYTCPFFRPSSPSVKNSWPYKPMTQPPTTAPLGQGSVLRCRFKQVGRHVD